MIPFYKVKLASGRVIGPFDLERIKLFIAKEKITELDIARLYPIGDWRSINTFPEIAELFILKLEGKLDVPNLPQTQSLDLSSSKIHPLANIDATPPSVENPQDEQHSFEQPNENELELDQEILTKVMEKSISNKAPAVSLIPNTDNEKTVVLTADDEKTIIAPRDELSLKKNKEIVLDNANQEKMIEVIPAGAEDIRADPKISNEKTAMLTMPPSLKGKFNNKKKLAVAIVIALCAVVVLFQDDKPAVDEESKIPFRVELPNAQVTDLSKSQKLYHEGIKFYSQDTVEGYKKAARIFLKSASLDSNNIKSICLLASSYMNLIDVLPRDENYFNVVTRLIELERAKGIDFPETVIADVELYHVLGNPDAAVNRIVEYSKTHPQFGLEMFYYLALSFYLKGQYSDALKYLNNIDPKAYFSPKINYLYGLIYEKNSESQSADEAIKSFLQAIERSPKHIKSRVKLAELYFHKDNLPESSKHADYVIQNSSQASRVELAKAYYYRSKMQMVAMREVEAMQDLEMALKNAPDDQDILLDFYTLKARTGAKIKDAQGRAKMFHYLALGEKAFKDGHLHEAMVHFLSARDSFVNDPTPLLRIAEVFQRQGDLQSTKLNLAKANKIAPKNMDIYPKYIKVLTDAYEFEDASRVLSSFKDLNPSVALVDRLQGDIYFKQEKLQDALAYYKRALNSSNIDSSIYIAYAGLMFKTGNYRDSAFFYGLARRFDPFNVDAVVGVGKSLAEIESVDSGVQFVQGVLPISPHKAALMNGVAEIYIRKGDQTTALKFVENALVADPKYSYAFKTKGDALVALNRTKEALDAYLTYTNLAPLDPVGHIERYKIYLSKLDLKSGKEEIQKVIDAYPKYPGIYFMLGELFREGHNYKMALEAAQYEIKNNPGYIPAYVLAASVLNQSKDYTNALALTNKALKVMPDYVPLLIQAAVANQNLKTYIAAQSLLERALSIDSGNPEIHKRLGALFYELNNTELSKQHFKAYLDLYPNAPDRGDIERIIK